MTDVVYLLGSGSTWADNEIKYSLRSLQRHADKIGQVYVIGLCPLFLDKEAIRYIPLNDNSIYPALNIKEKLLVSCETESVSKNFLYVHDDHFFMQDFSVDKYPNYCYGSMEEYIARANPFGAYTKCMEATLEALKEKGLPTVFYNVHRPMIINKVKFKKMVKQFDFTVPHSLVIKSLYGNLYGLEKTEMKDCKVSGRPALEAFKKEIKDKDFFSYHRDFHQDVKDWFARTFKEKSQWEK